MKIQFKSEYLIIFESALFRTTTTLIIGKEYFLLVDPNWLPLELDFIEQTIQTLGKRANKYLLFTHSDYDHIIGYGQFDDYKTIASQNFVDHPAPHTVVEQIEQFDDAYYIKRTYTIVYPSIDWPIAGAGQTLQLGADTYRFFQARGHNRDGLVSFNVTKGILIVGDYLSNIEFPYIYDSLKKYQNTLATLEELINDPAVQFLIPGHGDYTTNRQEMKDRIRESEAYLTDLEQSIVIGTAFDEASLLARYQFPRIMQRFHHNNIEVVKTYQ